MSQHPRYSPFSSPPADPSDSLFPVDVDAEMAAAQQRLALGNSGSPQLAPSVVPPAGLFGSPAIRSTFTSSPSLSSQPPPSSFGAFLNSSFGASLRPPQVQQLQQQQNYAPTSPAYGAAATIRTSPQARAMNWNDFSEQSIPPSSGGAQLLNSMLHAPPPSSLMPPTAGSSRSRGASPAAASRRKKSPHPAKPAAATSTPAAATTTTALRDVSEEGQVNWSDLPHESICYNEVFATHTFLQMGAATLPLNASVGINTQKKPTPVATTGATGLAAKVDNENTLTENDYLLLDTASNAQTVTNSQIILSRVAESFSAARTLPSDYANHHTRRSTTAFLSSLNRRAHIIQTSLDAIRSVQAKIFAQANPLVADKDAAGGDKLVRLTSKDTKAALLKEPAASFFSTSLVPSLASAVSPNPYATSSTASPTLRMLVLSFFPMLQSMSTHDAALKQSVMSTLVSVLSSLPTLGLKGEPSDCIMKFRELVQGETGTRARLVTRKRTDQGARGNNMMAEFNLAASSASPALKSATGPSSAASIGLALTTLMALAIQQGHLIHLLESIASCLQVAPITRSAVKELEKENSQDAAASTEAPNGVTLSADGFLTQLQNYRVSETFPQLGSSTFVGGWQHHSHSIRLHAPNKCNIDLPVQRSDASVVNEHGGVVARSLTASSSPSSADLPFLGSIASDGMFFYVYTLRGIAKIGSGYHGTIPGHVYQINEDFPKNPTAAAAAEEKKEDENEKKKVEEKKQEEPSAEPVAASPQSSSRARKSTKKVAPVVDAASASAASRIEDKSGGLVFVAGRLFFATPNFNALAPATSSKSSAAALSAPTMALLREIDPVTLNEIGDVEIVYKPSTSTRTSTAVTSSSKSKKDEKSTPVAAESKEKEKDKEKEKEKQAKDARDALPFYVSVTSDSTYIYGLYMNLTGLRSKRSSSSSSSTSTPSSSHPNTIGFANLVDVFTVHPTLRQVQFLRTITLEDTDGKGSKYDGMDRSLLPSSVTAASIGLQTLPTSSGFASSSAAPSGGFNDGTTPSTGIILMPYKTFVVGGGRETAPGYYVRMPSLPRFATTTPTQMSFKPDVFSLTTGKCVSRGGWNQNMYDTPTSVLQSHHASPASALSPSPRGTAICYDVRNDLIIDYSPFTLSVQMFSNSGALRHADFEDYATKRMRTSALNTASSSSTTNELFGTPAMQPASSTAMTSQLLPVCAIVLHHLARLAHLHEATPSQLSLIGVSTGRHVVPLTPFSNLALPTSTATDAKSTSTSLSASVIDGVDVSVFPKSQAMCVQITQDTFELLHDILFVLGRSLSSGAATDSVSSDAIYHSLVSALKVLKLNLSILSPPPIERVVSEITHSTASTAQNTPLLSSQPTVASSTTGVAAHNPNLPPTLAAQLKKLLLSFTTLSLPSSFADQVHASSEVRVQSLSALLAGLSHFYPTPADLSSLILSPLGSHPLVIQYLIQYPRLCLILSERSIMKEVIQENGLVQVLLRRVMEESTAQIQADGTAKSSSSDIIPSQSSEIGQTVSSATAVRTSPILTPAMQLLAYFHRSLLSRIEVDSNTRHACFVYCTSVINHAATFLSKISTFTLTVDSVVQSSLVGVLLPPILALLLRASSPTSHTGTAAAFASIASSLTQLVSGGASSSGPLIGLFQQIQQYQSRKLEAQLQLLGSEQFAASQIPNLPELERATQLIESTHPYVSVDSRTTASSVAHIPPFVPTRIPSKAYAFPGADYLVLIFDPKCSTAHRSDVLQIQSLEGRKVVAGCLAGKTPLHPTPTLATPGTLIELAMNSFPRTPVVIAGDTIMFSFAPEGTIRERERGTSVTPHHAQSQHSKTLLYYGYKVTVHGITFHQAKAAVAAASKSSGVAAVEWSHDLLNSTALVVGHCTQLAIFPPTTINPPAVVTPAAAVAPSPTPLSPLSPKPAAVQPIVNKKPNELQLVEVKQLLRSDLFANGAPQTSTATPQLDSFLDSFVRDPSVSVDWIEFMNRKVTGRPPLSAVARKCLIPIERVLLAAILHTLDLTRVAQAVSEEIRTAAVEHATATGATPNASSLPPPAFTPSHASFPLLKQAWSMLYQLDNSYLSLARLEKKFMDLVCATKTDRENEIKEMDNAAIQQLLDLKRVGSEKDVASATTATAAPATPAPAAAPASSSSSSATAAPVAAMNEAKRQQLIDKLTARVEQERAFYLAQPEHSITVTAPEVAEKKEEKEKEEKSEQKEQPLASSEKPTPTLTLDWPDAFRVAGDPFLARAFFLLSLRPSSGSWLVPRLVDSAAVHRSNSSVDANETGPSSSASSTTGSPKVGSVSSPNAAPSLNLQRSFTDTRMRGSPSSTTLNVDSDTLPLVRVNSLNRTASSVQRQLLSSSSSSKNLAALPTGREVVGSSISRSNSSTAAGAMATQDISHSLNRWRSWQRSSTPPRTGSFSSPPTDGQGSFDARLQLSQKFLASSLEPKWLTQQLEANRAEAESRVDGMKVLNSTLQTIITSTTKNVAAKLEVDVDSKPSLNAMNGLLYGLSECMRDRWVQTNSSGKRDGPHYLAAIEGVGDQLLAEVRSSFASLLTTFASLLTAPRSQIHGTTKLLALSCVGLMYQSPHDISLLERSHLVRAIFGLINADQYEKMTELDISQSLSKTAQSVFCQLAKVILLWTPTSSDSNVNSMLNTLQEDVLACLSQLIGKECREVKSIASAKIEATPVEEEKKSTNEEKKSTTSSRTLYHADDALHSYLLLVHALRQTAAVRKYLSRSETLTQMLSILHIQTSLLDASSIAESTNLLGTSSQMGHTSLRVQRLLIRLIRTMLSSSSDMVNRLLHSKSTALAPAKSDDVAQKQRAFVSALFERIGELLSGGIANSHVPTEPSTPTAASVIKVEEVKSEEKEAEKKEPESKEAEKKEAESKEAESSPQPSVPSSGAGATSSSDADKDTSTYSLSVHNSDSENVTGSQFATNLYAACRDLFKTLQRSPSSGSAAPSAYAIPPSSSGPSSKGDYRSQLAAHNVAVIMQGSREECTRIGKIMSGRGFVCSMTGIPPSDGLVRNLALEKSNPSYFISAAAALSLTAEYVTLLHVLGSTMLWNRSVEAEVLIRINRLADVKLDATNEASLISSLSLLAVLSGFRDHTVRIGAKVIVSSLEQDENELLATSNATNEGSIDSSALSTATIISYMAGKKDALVVMDVDGAPAPSATKIAVSRLRTFNNGQLANNELMVQPIIIDPILVFLQRALTSTDSVDTSASISYSLMHQELVLYALRFLTTILSHPRHSRALLNRSDLISLLISSAKRCPASSCGYHASASHLAQLESQSSRLRERWIELVRPIQWRNATASDASSRNESRKQESDSSDEKSLAVLLPYQPTARTASSLPTSVSLDSNMKYLLLETNSTKSGPVTSVTFTRDASVSMPADFLVGLGLGRGLDGRSGNGARRIEEQLRVESSNLGLGEGEFCVLGNAAIDLTLSEYYFEVTLQSAHPMSVGLAPRIPVSNVSNANDSVDQNQEQHGGRGHRQDGAAVLQQKLQQLLKSRVSPWPQQSIRLQGKDGRVIRKTQDTPNTIPGKDLINPYTDALNSGDVVGVHWNLIDGVVSFTRNGRHLGTAFTVSMGGSSRPSPAAGGASVSSAPPLTVKLYPAVSFSQQNSKASFNFGAQPFVYKLPKLSAVAETEEEKAARLKRAEEAARLAKQKEDEAATRREVERIALEASRAEIAQSILDMTGGLLPSRRHALCALAMHRWDPSAVANWLLENEQAALTEISRRLREEDREKAAEVARKKEEEKAAAEKKAAAAAQSTPPTPKSTSQTATATTKKEKPVASVPTTYDSSHTSTVALTPAYSRPHVPVNDSDANDPYLEEWLQQMESVLIGARLERPELVQQLMRQLRAGGEERANALLSLPSNVNVPVLRKAEAKPVGPAVKPEQAVIQMSEVRIGMRAHVSARTYITACLTKSGSALTRAHATAAAASDSDSGASNCWLTSMITLQDRVVTICDVDREHLDTSELVRIQCNFIEQSGVETWWVPLAALRHVEDPAQEDCYIGMLELADLTKYRYVNQQLANLLARQAVMAWLSSVGPEGISALAATSSSVSLTPSPQSVELGDLLSIIASERVSTLQLMPSVNTSVGQTAASLPVVPVPPIFDTLFTSSLQANPNLLSSLFTASTRDLMADTVLIDTDLEADKELIGGDNSTAGSGPFRQLTAGENASGILVTFASTTRLPKRDDRVTFVESTDPTTLNASPSSTLTLAHFTSPSTKSVLAKYIGGDKNKATPLQPFFYPLSTNPLASAYVQLSKDKATGMRTIRLKAEVVPVPSSNKFGLGVWMANRIIDKCSSLVESGEKKDSSHSVEWRSKLRATLSAVGGFLLTPRCPPVIRIALFQLLVRGLFTLRDITPMAYPEPIDMHIAGLYKEMTALYRCIQQNHRATSGSSGSGNSGSSAKPSSLPFYAVQPQYVSIYFQSLVELVATYRRVFGDHIFKQQVIDTDPAKTQAQKILIGFTTPTINRAVSVKASPSTASTPITSPAFSFGNAAESSETPAATPSSAASSSAVSSASASVSVSVSASESAPVSESSSASASSSASVASASAPAPAPAPAPAVASASAPAAASDSAPASVSVSAPAPDPVAAVPAAAASAPAPVPAPASAPVVPPSPASASSAVPRPVPVAQPRRSAPAVQVDQLCAMGFSEHSAEAALIQFGSLNAALDALMAGFVPPEPEPEPAPVVEPEAPVAAPESEEDNDRDDNGGNNGGDGGDDDDMAAAIAMSMAVAAEDDARDAAIALSNSEQAIDTPSKSAEAELATGASSASSTSSTSAPSTTSGDTSSSAAPQPLTQPLITETWFDAFCRASDLLDCFHKAAPLPLGASTACLDISYSHSSLAPSIQAASAVLLESEHASFTPAMDAEIVAFANLLETKYNTKLMSRMRDLTWVADMTSLVSTAAALRTQFPFLSAETPKDHSTMADTGGKVITNEKLVRRLCLLVYLNYLLQGCFALIDLSLAAQPSGTGSQSTSSASIHSLAQHLSFFRSLVLSSNKVDFFHTILDITSTDSSEGSKTKPKVSIDRLRAASNPGLKQSIFHQTYQHLAHITPAYLMPSKPVGNNPFTAFDTTFRGEHVVGESGPYRELMNDIVRELQQTDSSNVPAGSSHVLPFLIPTINHRVAVGDGRDRFLLNPSCISESDRQHFHFLGMIIGIAIRTSILLPFAFPSMIWKQLLGIQTTRDDLEGIDASFVTGVLAPLESEDEDEARFTEHFSDSLTWSTTLSDGKTIDLKPSGSTIPVQFGERLEYARLAEWARLNENREQIASLKQGLCTIIPASMLSLFTAAEFERLVCGVPFIDVDLLKRHTEYSGVSEKDQHIQWFWTCLQEMTQEERRAFLVFSSAQQRMPSSDEEFTTRSGSKIRMLIKAPVSKKGASNDQDARFMTADTCFWNISLPRYSSLETMRKQLSVCLAHSSGMDGDDVAMMDREPQHDFEQQMAYTRQQEAELRGGDVEPEEEVEDIQVEEYDEDEPDEEAQSGGEDDDPEQSDTDFEDDGGAGEDQEEDDQPALRVDDDIQLHDDQGQSIFSGDGSPEEDQEHNESDEDDAPPNNGW